MNPVTLVPNTATAVLLDRVYKHIAGQPLDGDVSLMSGQMGYALLEAYANSYYGITDDSRVWSRVSECLTAIQHGELHHSFASGMAGIAWGFLHLCNQGLLQTDEIDHQDIVADLDEALFEISLDYLRSGDYDYLHGGLSAGLYFLERQPSPILTRYVSELLEALSATAIRFSDGAITWRFDHHNRPKTYEAPRYNPSLSHGTASIVALLSLLYERGYARQRCAELIRGTLQWMWQNRNRSGISTFPNFVHETRQDQDSRLGWCYGDLGIASTFWLCGQKLRHAPWRTVAYETMLKAAVRRSTSDAAIHDAGLCHGSAGVAYLFRRFGRQSSHPAFHQAADYWMQQTARLATMPSQDNVFLSYLDKQYTPNLGLLDGESSIGLVLLTELGAPPAWERFLLLS